MTIRIQRKPFSPRIARAMLVRLLGLERAAWQLRRVGWWRIAPRETESEALADVRRGTTVRTVKPPRPRLPIGRPPKYPRCRHCGQPMRPVGRARKAA